MPATTTRSRASTDRPRYARLAVAAEIYDVSIRTLRRRIADGSLRCYRMGPKIIRVDLNEVDALMVATRGGDS